MMKMKKIKIRNYIQLIAWKKKGGPHTDKRKEIPRRKKYKSEGE